MKGGGADQVDWEFACPCRKGKSQVRPDGVIEDEPAVVSAGINKRYPNWANIPRDNLAPSKVSEKTALSEG